MLSQDEENYLLKIPEDKVVEIKLFDARGKQVADSIIDQLKNKHPELNVIHMGASGLGISGQGDLDIYALVPESEIQKYVPSFIGLFGQPKVNKPNSVKWEFVMEGYPVELYITDQDSEPMRRQIRVFEILKNNAHLLREYELLKLEMNGKPLREYQRKKYEFYHRILD